MYKPGWFHLAHPSPLETIYVQIQKVGNFLTKFKNTHLGLPNPTRTACPLMNVQRGDPESPAQASLPPNQ